jgi:hypothetical protein
VAEQRVVVEAHLGVEREHVAVAGDHQRVDLDQRGVGVDVGLGRASTSCAALKGRLPSSRPKPAWRRGPGTGAAREAGRSLAEDRLGSRRDLLDVHAAEGDAIITGLPRRGRG